MIASRYAFLQKEIGRLGKSPCIIAVTKNASLSQMQEAYSLGIRDFAESRLQDALKKMPHLPSDIHWHFIGRIQSNKVIKIVESFDYIHSISSQKTLELVNTESQKLAKHPHLFLQVNVSQESSKSGFTEQEVLSLDLSHYKNVVGLMTIAPLTENAGVIRSCFHRLAQLQKSMHLLHLSMGMSHDFSLALEEGATFLRIGSFLFS